MIKIAGVTFAALTLGASQLASANPIAIPNTKVSMEACMNAALQARAGHIKELAMELENGVPLYEFEIKATDNKVWEVTCNAMTGTVAEIEEEVEDASEQVLKAKFEQAAKISEARAKDIALNAHPGQVLEVERELEATEGPVYEVKVKTVSKELSIEVSAITGKIVEVEEDVYEIGAD